MLFSLPAEPGVLQRDGLVFRGVFSSLHNDQGSSNLNSTSPNHDSGLPECSSLPGSGSAGKRGNGLLQKDRVQALRESDDDIRN